MSLPADYETHQDCLHDWARIRKAVDVGEDDALWHECVSPQFFAWDL